MNWIVDLDIRSFFDKIGHDWLIQFVEHRIGDKRIVRLIQKWLKAGVMENGTWYETEEGTPQGAVISPILANVYLHYVLDVWAKAWRTKVARGDMIIVGYADDAVLGFENREEAERLLEPLRERVRKFGLELHPDKTRLIEFGRYAADLREEAWRREAGELQLSGVHPHLWEEQQDGVLRHETKDDRQTNRSQAEGCETATAKKAARVNREYGEVAPVGGAGLLPIPCHSGQ